MFAEEDRFYTPAEYFALEEQADHKSEYRQGEIVAMAGGSLNHNRIAKNTYFAIDEALEKKSCESFLGMYGYGLKKKSCTLTRTSWWCVGRPN